MHIPGTYLSHIFHFRVRVDLRSTSTTSAKSKSGWLNTPHVRDVIDSSGLSLDSAMVKLWTGGRGKIVKTGRSEVVTLSTSLALSALSPPI